MKSFFEKLLFACCLTLTPILAFSGQSMFKEIKIVEAGKIDAGLSKMIESRGIESLSPYKSVSVRDLNFKSEGAIVTKETAKTPFTATVQLDAMVISVEGTITIGLKNREGRILSASDSDGRDVALDIQTTLQEAVAPVIAGVTQEATEAVIKALVQSFLKPAGTSK